MKMLLLTSLSFAIWVNEKNKIKKNCNLPFIVIEIYSTSRSSTAENPGNFKKGYFAS